MFILNLPFPPTQWNIILLLFWTPCGKQAILQFIIKIVFWIDLLIFKARNDCHFCLHSRWVWTLGNIFSSLLCQLSLFLVDCHYTGALLCWLGSEHRKYRNKKTKFLRNYSVEIWKYFRLINLAEIDQLQLQSQNTFNTLLITSSFRTWLKISNFFSINNLWQQDTTTK